MKQMELTVEGIANGDCVIDSGFCNRCEINGHEDAVCFHATKVHFNVSEIIDFWQPFLLTL
jgi:hypothetical protein